MREQHTLSVVCFGESLWDIFPDGGKVPGGAPMNVAYHLRQLGIDSPFISSIGNDVLGKTLLSEMTEKGISTTYCQTDNMHPTGTVLATMDEHLEMSYDIVSPVAWDFIRFEERYRELVSTADAFVFGSLAGRSEVSHKTLGHLLSSAKYRIFDVNLRPPYYTKEEISESLKKTDLLKLNQHELKIIGEWMDPPASSRDHCIQRLFDLYPIAGIILTEGEHGAWYYSKNEKYDCPAFRVSVVDTVGSGDAFLAAFVSCYLGKQQSIPESLKFASALAAYVATQKGACPKYQPEDIRRIINAGK